MTSWLFKPLLTHVTLCRYAAAMTAGKVAALLGGLKDPNHLLQYLQYGPAGAPEAAAAAREVRAW